MDEKQSVLQRLIPLASLRAISEEAKASVPSRFISGNLISIRNFPFMVGRESRVKEIHGKTVKVEREKLNDRKAKNDLYLIDSRKPLQISRQHFQIEKNSSGYLLIDTESTCGLSLKKSGSSEIIRIGGKNKGGEAILNDGDTLFIGAADTPYIFEFIDLDDST